MTRTDGPSLNGALAGTGRAARRLQRPARGRAVDRRLDRMRIAEVEVIPYALPFKRALRDRPRDARAAGDGAAAAANRRRAPSAWARPCRCPCAAARRCRGSSGRCFAWRGVWRRLDVGGDDRGGAARRRGRRGDPRGRRAAAARAGQGGGGDRPSSTSPAGSRGRRCGGCCAASPRRRCDATRRWPPARRTELAAEAAALERARLRDLQAQARDRRRCRTGAGGPRGGRPGRAPASGRQRRLERRSGRRRAGRDRAARDRAGRAARRDLREMAAVAAATADPDRRRRERDERQGGEASGRRPAPAAWPR